MVGELRLTALNTSKRRLPECDASPVNACVEHGPGAIHQRHAADQSGRTTRLDGSSPCRHFIIDKQSVSTGTGGRSPGHTDGKRDSELEPTWSVRLTTALIARERTSVKRSDFDGCRRVMSTLLHFPSGGGLAGSDHSTADLLSFVDIASSNIKLALDKPTKSKRKVNHRKYLQKQLKRCAGGGATVSGAAGKVNAESADGRLSHMTSTSGHHGACASTKAHRKETNQIGLQRKSLQALFDPRTLHARCCAEPGYRVTSGQKVPLRKRNLPASFFTEPVNAFASATTPSAANDFTLSAMLSFDNCRAMEQIQQQQQQQSLVNHHHSQTLQSNQQLLQQQQQCCLATLCDSQTDPFEPLYVNHDLNDILGDAWQEEGAPSSASTTPCSVRSTQGEGTDAAPVPADLVSTRATVATQRETAPWPLPYNNSHVSFQQRSSEVTYPLLWNHTGASPSAQFPATSAGYTGDGAFSTFPCEFVAQTDDALFPRTVDKTYPLDGQALPVIPGIGGFGYPGSGPTAAMTQFSAGNTSNMWTIPTREPRYPYV